MAPARESLREELGEGVGPGGKGGWRKRRAEQEAEVIHLGGRVPMGRNSWGWG